MTTDAIRDLTIACRHAAPVLFLGTGFSVEAGYPTTSELVADLLMDLNSQNPGASGGLTSRDLDLVSWKYETRLGAQALDDFLRVRFGRPPARPPRSYEVIAKRPELTPIITTNFDTGLTSYLGVPPTLSANDYRNRIRSPRLNLRVVLHVHGHADWLHHGRVITKQDYAKFYDQPGADALLHEIVSQFQVRPFVFVGYSLADVNIMRLLYVANKEAPQQRTIWIVCPDATDLAIERHGMRFNIRPIPCGSSEFFERYQQLCGSPPRAPRPRPLTMRRGKLRLLLAAIFDVLDCGSIAEELTDWLFDHPERFRIGLRIAVSPGKHLVRLWAGDAAISEILLSYETTEERIPVDCAVAELQTKLTGFLAALPDGCRFGIPVPGVDID